MIVDNEDGGLNIKFSHEDLVAMPPSDFQLLQLFVEALTEEYGKEEVNDSAQSEADSRPVRRNDQIPPEAVHHRRHFIIRDEQYRARWISLTTLTSKYIEIPQEESIIA